MLRIIGGKGFQMTLDNGWTVSVMMGEGNYCSNRSMMPSDESLSDTSSVDAEIAAWDKDGKWHDFGYDKVEGYQNTAEILAFINMIAAK